MSLPSGELARAITHESSDEYPTMIEIVAWWGQGGRKGRRRSIEIPAAQFFGTGGEFHAPLTGDLLIHMIEQLRKAGPRG